MIRAIKATGMRAILASTEELLLLGAERVGIRYVRLEWAAGREPHQDEECQ